MADGCVALEQNGRQGSVQHQPGPSACHLALARRRLGNDRERMASVGRSWEVITAWNPCRNNTSGSVSQKCGELYTDTGLNSWFLSVRTVEPRISPETENPWLHPALSDPDVLRSEAQRKFNCTLGDGWKGRERERRWYTKTICGENQPWQHYSFSVEWRYPGSCVTPLYSITAHIFLLNPITADQCCLFHS